MVRVKATKHGLELDEPLVIAKMNDGGWTPPRTMAQVRSFYGPYVDLDELATFGYQKVVAGENVIIFKFTK